MLDRTSFPESHPLFTRAARDVREDLGDRLTGHDLVVVVGAAAFRYYPYVPGEYLPTGTELLQVTADPQVAKAARVGDSLVGDSQLALEQIMALVTVGSARSAPEP